MKLSPRTKGVLIPIYMKKIEVSVENAWRCVQKERVGWGFSAYRSETIEVSCSYTGAHMFSLKTSVNSACIPV